jgi:hypothetical protein
LLTVLCILDYLFISSAYAHTMIRGASAQIVFGFEVKIDVSLSMVHSRFILSTTRNFHEYISFVF